jgi:hypothetical protein
MHMLRDLSEMPNKVSTSDLTPLKELPRSTLLRTLAYISYILLWVKAHQWSSVESLQVIYTRILCEKPKTIVL